MTIYIVVFTLNMVFWQLLKYVKMSACSRKKVYLFVTAISYGLLCGLRSARMSYDTYAYEMVFDGIDTAWGSLFNKQIWVEYGYYLFCWVIKVLGGSFQTLLIVSSLFIMGSTCVFIYRHTEHVCMGVFTLVCFPYFYTSFDIIRHYLATAFFLLGFKYVIDRKFWRYVVWIMLGAQFHKVAYVFLLFYWLPSIKWNRISSIICLCFTAVGYFWLNDIFRILSVIMDKGTLTENYWVNDVAGGELTALMYMVIAALVIVAHINNKEKCHQDTLGINCILILALLAVVYMRARIAIRMMVTIIPLVSISVPGIIARTRGKRVGNTAWMTRLCYVAIALVYHGYLLRNNWQHIIPYIPFWE